MKSGQNILDLFPVRTMQRASLSTYYMLCPCCKSRVDAFPTGNDSTGRTARGLSVCQLCEMSFDYTDKDVRQTEDEPPLHVSMNDDTRRFLPVTNSSPSLISQEAENMDPNQTFDDMFNAMCVEDHETARESAIALKSWLAKGGFYPNQHTPEAVRSYLASVLWRTAESQEQKPPFKLACSYCDAGEGISSEEEAMNEGWIAIEPALQLIQANCLGVCPDCRERHAEPSKE